MLDVEAPYKPSVAFSVLVLTEQVRRLRLIAKDEHKDRREKINTAAYQLDIVRHNLAELT